MRVLPARGPSMRRVGLAECPHPDVHLRFRKWDKTNLVSHFDYRGNLCAQGFSSLRQPVWRLWLQRAGVAGAAPAPSSVALGGGSGILLPDVDHSDPDRVAACTLTAVGYDNAGSLVALTAGHCGVVGDRVFAEYLPEAGPIGRFSYSSPVSDIAVIDLDDAKVAPLAYRRRHDDQRNRRPAGTGDDRVQGRPFDRQHVRYHLGLRTPSTVRSSSTRARFPVIPVDRSSSVTAWWA